MENLPWAIVNRRSGDSAPSSKPSIHRLCILLRGCNNLYWCFLWVVNDWGIGARVLNSEIVVVLVSHFAIVDEEKMRSMSLRKAQEGLCWGRDPVSVKRQPPDNHISRRKSLNFSSAAPPAHSRQKHRCKSSDSKNEIVEDPRSSWPRSNLQSPSAQTSHYQCGGWQLQCSACRNEMIPCTCLMMETVERISQ